MSVWYAMIVDYKILLNSNSFVSKDIVTFLSIFLLLFLNFSLLKKNHIVHHIIHFIINLTYCYI